MTEKDKVKRDSLYKLKEHIEKELINAVSEKQGDFSQIFRSVCNDIQYNDILLLNAELCELQLRDICRFILFCKNQNVDIYKCLEIYFASKK